METQLQVFNSSDFGEVRTTVRDGEPWFVAVDVCKALSIINHRDALGRLDEDEKGVALTDTLGGKQNLTIVNEPGLYTLVLGSRKPAAKAFKRWVTHEVLPALRKTGRYSIEDESDLPSPVYETKRTSVGEVASLLLQLKQIQKAQGASSRKIAKTALCICQQFGIALPADFIEPPKPTSTYTQDCLLWQPTYSGRKLPWE